MVLHVLLDKGSLNIFHFIFRSNSSTRLLNVSNFSTKIICPKDKQMHSKDISCKLYCPSQLLILLLIIISNFTFSSFQHITNLHLWRIICAQEKYPFASENIVYANGIYHHFSYNVRTYISLLFKFNKELFEIVFSNRGLFILTITSTSPLTFSSLELGNIIIPPLSVTFLNNLYTTELYMQS